MIPISADAVNWLAVAVVVGSFLVAGTVKGVLGVGLPMISVPLMATVIGPAHAIALASVPIIVSNVWQAFQGGHHRECLRRFWPTLALVVVGTLVGVQILATVDPRAVSVVLAVLLMVTIGLRLARLNPTLSPRAETWVGPPLGFAAGVLGGVSSISAPLVVVYLVSLRLPKDLFVGAVALFYFSGSLPMIIGLYAHRILTPEYAIYSAASSVPVVCGLVIGHHLRRHIPQSTFEKVLYAVLFVIGLNLIRRAVL